MVMFSGCLVVMMFYKVFSGNVFWVFSGNDVWLGV